MAFKEILSSSVIGDSDDYETTITECFDMYCDKHNKPSLKLHFNADENIGVSKNIIMSFISPLLENAVTASLDNKEIRLSVSRQDEWTNITIENECATTPKISDLKTLGYSSKEGHIGTGLNTVRHFLVLLGGKELQISTDKNNIKFKINIPVK